jgi:hypothetical protein
MRILKINWKECYILSKSGLFNLKTTNKNNNPLAPFEKGDQRYPYFNWTITKPDFNNNHQKETNST